MGFEQEWADRRTEATQAVDAQSSSMQLNQLAPDGGGSATPPSPLAPGGSSGTFGSTPAQKRTAASKIENDLKPTTQWASDLADESTNNAITGFGGWDTCAGLKKVKETWETQAKMLLGRLEREQNALLGARSMFLRNDVATYDGFGPLNRKSGLDGLGR
ncbi:hypothetical protein [Streptomyces marianii]|uniref:Uncharacterized protein n=1 Tax=Streptomyces marianii TaxID=1817406 RepID=A0A5R9E098_9ACTN|nr:hypothetical protein [Streptomyces marianii]TLQ43348.1 hypothetical protein FEF34_09535 [Streptomyces marianii]